MKWRKQTQHPEVITMTVEDYNALVARLITAEVALTVIQAVQKGINDAFAESIKR